MGPLCNLTGKTFGKWTVLHRVPNKGKRVYWRCICECGTERDVMGYTLTKGMSQSCGDCQELTADDFLNLATVRQLAWEGYLPQPLHTRTKWRCPNGHLFLASYYTISNQKNCCGACSNV